MTDAKVKKRSSITNLGMTKERHWDDVRYGDMAKQNNTEMMEDLRR
ncbi:MAG TPA: hypothetical protein PLQ76_02735 [bacterium]|nr:hypothetical protein [bacterium]